MECGGCNGPSSGTPDGLAFERHYFLTDQVAASSRAQNGQTVQVQTSVIPLRDRAGRYAHVTDMLVIGDAQFTTTATTTVTGYSMLSLINQIYTQDISGHEYIAGLDWRDLRDDVLIRNAGDLPVADPAAYAATVTTTVTATTTISFYYQFADFDVYGDPMVDGMIPLAALRALGGNALRFRVNTDFAEPIANVTWDGFQNTLHVYLGIVYLDHVHVDAPWNINNYTIAENQSSLYHCERLTEYAALWPQQEDTGDDDVDDYSNITIQGGGIISKSGLSLAQSLSQDRIHFQTAAQAEMSALGLPGTTNAVRGLFLVPPPKNRKGGARGSVQYNFGTRSTHTTNRFLHRTVGAMDAQREMRIRASAGVLQGFTTKTDQMGMRPPAAKLKPYLPMTVAKKAG